MKDENSSLVDDRIGDEVLSREKISEGVSEVAGRINSDFGVMNLVMIVVSPGGIFFAADLARKLTMPLCIDTILCPHNPGDRSNRSSITYIESIPIRGRHVLLVDDAIESGGTMSRLLEYLKVYEPESLSVATLFVKPSRRKIEANCYYAYELESDELMVGYGLPWKDELRNLSSVHQLENSTI